MEHAPHYCYQEDSKVIVGLRGRRTCGEAEPMLSQHGAADLVMDEDGGGLNHLRALGSPGYLGAEDFQCSVLFQPKFAITALKREESSHK